MAKYYFIILLTFCGIYGRSQECNSRNLLALPMLWSGDLDRFAISENAPWQLADSVANTSSLLFYTDTATTKIQFSFSLDFPPSAANRFELELGLKSKLGGGEAQLIMRIGESGSWDGLQVDYTAINGSVIVHTFWDGAFAAGADRTSWTIELTPNGIEIEDINSGERVTIPWESPTPEDMVITEVGLVCHYTVTRSRHFLFHHLYAGSDGDFAADPGTGTIFISESRFQGGVNPDFIELYSFEDFSSCVHGLRLEINENVVDLPPMRIAAGKHLVISDPAYPVLENQDAQFLFLDLPPIEGSSAIEIVLFHYNRPIHGVRIRPHQNPNDGRSWEMLDITRPCRTDNWAASKVETGTPGMENSWFTTLDEPALQLRWQTPTTAVLHFPYLFLRGDETNLNLTSNRDFTWNEQDFWGNARLLFTGELHPGDSIHIGVEAGFTVCQDRMGWDTVYHTVAPAKGQAEGLMITEIMYEPVPGCPEYLEITNMEPMTTWWDRLEIQKNEISPLHLFVDGGWPSNQCRVFTQDRIGFSECYPEAEAALIYEVDLFALNNNGADLTLLATDPVTRIIDKTSYHPGLHNYLIKNTAGVVLERNIFGLLGNNWRSGFVQFTYRSPGFLPIWDLSSGIEIDFSTSVVYTGNVREPAHLQISVGAESLDGSITIEIFDLNGNKIQTLANAIPVQGGEEFYWRGRSSHGQLLPEGLYLFWIYYFDSLGHKKTVKRTCVLSNN